MSDQNLQREGEEGLTPAQEGMDKFYYDAYKPPQQADEWEKEYMQIDFGILTPHSTAELLHWSNTIKDFIRSTLKQEKEKVRKEGYEEGFDEAIKQVNELQAKQK